MDDEAGEAIRAIEESPDLQATLLRPLTTESWRVRADVQLILGWLDDLSSGVVRRVAFEKRLVNDPQRFIAAAIYETQDCAESREEALEAYRRTGDHQAVARLHERLAFTAWDQGRFERAQQVLAEGFGYAGQVYGSLSAVAKAVTGSHCNGFLFFRLNDKGDNR